MALITDVVRDKIWSALYRSNDIDLEDNQIDLFLKELEKNGIWPHAVDDTELDASTPDPNVEVPDGAVQTLAAGIEGGKSRNS